MDPEYPNQLSRAPNPNTQLVEFTPQILTTTRNYRIDWWNKILQTFCNIFWIFNLFPRYLWGWKSIILAFILKTFELNLTICLLQRLKRTMLGGKIYDLSLMIVVSTLKYIGD